MPIFHTGLSSASKINVRKNISEPVCRSGDLDKSLLGYSIIFHFESLRLIFEYINITFAGEFACNYFMAIANTLLLLNTNFMLLSCRYSFIKAYVDYYFPYSISKLNSHFIDLIPEMISKQCKSEIL